MRRVLALVTVMAAALIVANRVALAGTIRCKPKADFCRRPNHQDRLIGTGRVDKIVGLGGNDDIEGRGAAHKLFGGDDPNAVYGEKGASTSGLTYFLGLDPAEKRRRA